MFGAIVKNAFVLLSGIDSLADNRNPWIVTITSIRPIVNYSECLKNLIELVSSPDTGPGNTVVTLIIMFPLLISLALAFIVSNITK